MSVKKKSRDKNQGFKPDVGANLNALPNTFKFAAEALKLMSERSGSARSIVLNKYKSYNYKHIYALAMNTAKNIKIIKKIIHETKLAKKVPENDPFLLEILVGELLFGRGLKPIEQNSTAATILHHKEAILKQQAILKKDYGTNLEAVTFKYLRVNPLKSNMEHVLSQLKSVGLTELEYTKEKIKFKKFISKFKSMDKDEFMLDFHFPKDLIILRQEGAKKLGKTDLFKKGKAMLQDKASFLAVEAMEVEPNHKVIDACCAPGSKTSLIAGKMRNKGKIVAYDVDKKRLLTAIHLLKVQGVTCAKTEVHDFSKVKLQRVLKTHGVDSFNSILIDPSCSGSGIESRVDYKSSSSEPGRLKKLQAFQVSLLKHALKANISETIVYCTCSTSVEENEQVIEMALEESGVKSKWDVVDILPYWPHRGEANYEFGTKCLRSDKNNLTNGFFIAKLKRNLEPSPVAKVEKKKEKQSQPSADLDDGSDTDVLSDDGTEIYGTDEDDEEWEDIGESNSGMFSDEEQDEDEETEDEETGDEETGDEETEDEETEDEDVIDDDDDDDDVEMSGMSD